MSVLGDAGLSVGGLIVGGGALAAFAAVLTALISAVVGGKKRKTDYADATLELSDKFNRRVDDANKELRNDISDLHSEVDQLRDLVGELRDQLRIALPIVKAAGHPIDDIQAALLKRVAP